MKKIKNPWVHREGYDCFGCCPDNPLGVHMEFYEDGNDIVSYWKPQTHYQGWINTMHGGILSTLIDETAGWVVFRKMQTSGVTSKLEIKYKKPVMTTEPMLTLRGHIVSQLRNLVTIEVTLQNAAGEVCTVGQAVYYTFPQDKAKEMGFDTCEVEEEDVQPLSVGC